MPVEVGGLISAAAMAGPQKTTSPGKSFDPSDLDTLVEDLYSVRDRFKFFALQIGVSKDELNGIRANNGSCEDCLLEVLDHRLRKSKALTYSDIDKALRSNSVDEPRLADSLCKKYHNMEEAMPTGLTGQHTEYSGEESEEKRGIKRPLPTELRQCYKKLKAEDHEIGKGMHRKRTHPDKDLQHNISGKNVTLLLYHA